MQLLLVLLAALAPVAVALWYIFRKDSAARTDQVGDAKNSMMFIAQNNNKQKMFNTENKLKEYLFCALNKKL